MNPQSKQQMPALVARISRNIYLLRTQRPSWSVIIHYPILIAVHLAINFVMIRKSPFEIHTLDVTKHKCIFQLTYLEKVTKQYS
jgi:hypothetical protein